MFFLFMQTRYGTLRGSVWKILLGVFRLDAMEYISLVKKGTSSAGEKIQNDVFRTLATDKLFCETVTTEMLTRVLNAFVWKATGISI
jgi:cell cycle arrest protein BUB2